MGVGSVERARPTPPQAALVGDHVVDQLKFVTWWDATVRPHGH